MIDTGDLNDLLGRGMRSQDKWLSNFIFDEYLCLIKLACAANNSLAVETIPWEMFERGVGLMPASDLSGCSPCGM